MFNFPLAQEPLKFFQRGPSKIHQGEVCALITYAAGRIRPVPQASKHWLPWLAVTLYQPELHKKLICMGRWQGRPLLVHLASPRLAKEENWPSLRSWILTASAEGFDLLATAAGLARWYEEHKFCGRCGVKNFTRDDEFAKQCPKCHLRHYPRVSPCIITLVWRPKQLLLARSPRFAEGVYSTLAGFIETGESAEQALHREVAEEVGVQVEQLEYFGSQAWPFPHSLMLGYFSRYQSGDIQIQEEELEDAQWFDLDKLPPLPSSNSIARKLIDSFLLAHG